MAQGRQPAPRGARPPPHGLLPTPGPRQARPGRLRAPLGLETMLCSSGAPGSGQMMLTGQCGARGASAKQHNARQGGGQVGVADFGRDAVAGCRPRAPSSRAQLSPQLGCSAVSTGRVRGRCSSPLAWPPHSDCRCNTQATRSFPAVSAYPLDCISSLQLPCTAYFAGLGESMGALVRRCPRQSTRRREHELLLSAGTLWPECKRSLSQQRYQIDRNTNTRRAAVTAPAAAGPLHRSW